MPSPSPLRIYLDANVLFSASFRPKSRFLDFWELQGVEVCVSPYVVGETRRNARSQEQLERLDRLIEASTMVGDGPLLLVPSNMVLAEKDRPVLATAIAAGVDYLVTGDKVDFGAYFGQRFAEVEVIAPAEALRVLALRSA